MLTNNDIEKFQALYKAEFGVQISREQAIEQGTKLVSLMSNVYKPMTQEDFDFIESHRKLSKSGLEMRFQEDKDY